MNEYPPIEDHGLVGDLKTCALVSLDGTVDWCPFPGVESPSVFAGILDAERGGHFTVAPEEEEFDAEQAYIDRTNVLQTTFTTGRGEIRLTDFMVPTKGDIGADGERALYRKVEGRDGTVPIDMAFRPQFDYGRAETTITARDESVIATAGETTTE
ncbi:trehalase-like domain-containing protein [Halorussus sp. MSC15.2]|uniref:trehalase-like domain-containing protein n=1 Tax=Halorussus sp. MSC15.2 TaxID=2283638 RepID=UPI001F073B3A|nr:trehalase-like domain-containing protein [Halorussus sp. MSC15.2]